MNTHHTKKIAVALTLLAATTLIAEAADPPVSFWLTIVEMSPTEVKKVCGARYRGCSRMVGTLCEIVVPRVHDWTDTWALETHAHEVRHCARVARGIVGAEDEHAFKAARGNIE